MSETVIQRAWELLEKEGLSGLTPQRLTIYCEKIESDILNHCPTPLSILLLLWDHVARQSVSQAVPDNPHDCLFESVMTVLEVLQPRRQAMKRLLDDLVTAPCWMKDIHPYALKWSRQTLQQADLNTGNTLGTFKTHAFALFCFYILKIWSTDESPDCDLTMVKLDQGLSKMLQYNSLAASFL